MGALQLIPYACPVISVVKLLPMSISVQDSLYTEPCGDSFSLSSEYTKFPMFLVARPVPYRGLYRPPPI